MYGNSYSNHHHEAFEPDGVEDIGTEEERCPQHGEDIHLDTTGNHPVLAEIANIRSQLGMAHQPVVRT